MAVYRWHPVADFHNLQREMNRLFDDMAGGNNPEETLAHSGWTPSVDILEKNDDIVLVAELPGVSKGNIKLSVNDGVLSLSGEKPAPEVLKDDCYHCAERFFGPFERKFSLPSNVDPNKIKADFNDGILRITLPKAEEAKPKEIKISA